MLGSRSRVRSRLQCCFLDEVAPAFVPIGGVLGILKLLQFRFCALLAPDHCDHPSGAVGADVVPDDGVSEIVACQKESIPSSLRNDQAAVGRARSSHPMSPMISASRIKSCFRIKLRTSFVDPQRTPVEHLSIQHSNGGLGFSRLRHLDKRDAAGFASVPVYDERDSFDGSMSCKNFSQLLVCYRDVKVPDKNIGHEVHSCR
jgi:hypothetical protein